MFPQATLFTSLALTIAPSHAKIQGVTSPGVSYGDHLPNSTIADGLPDTYNATVHVPFQGLNVTHPFPGTPVDGFSLNLYLAADIPYLPDENEGQDASEKSQFLTATTISMSGPDGMRAKDMHNSWAICNTIIMIPGSKKKAVNGSCDDVLTQDCQDSLLEQVSAPDTCQARVRPDDNERCGKVFKIVTEISTVIGKESETIYASNRTDSLIWRTKLAALDGINTEKHAKGNFTAYDAALKAIYVVPVIFKQNASALHNSTMQNQDASSVAGNNKLFCLQPHSFAEGSRTSGTTKSSSLQKTVFIPLLGLVLYQLL